MPGRHDRHHLGDAATIQLGENVTVRWTVRPEQLHIGRADVE
jgi:hypothetical protein